MFKIKWRYVKKFFVVFISITGIYFAMAAAVTLTMIAADNSVRLSIEIPTLPPSSINDSQKNPGANPGNIPPPAPDDDEGLLRPPARTHFLLIGLDQERVLTDALMAGCFYRDSLEIKLMSIPRDMYTLIPEHRMNQMRAEGRRPPGEMKINGLRSYGGLMNGTAYLAEQLGEMLGVKFQYFIEVDLPAFRKIVDMLDGVYMDIPSPMKYSDPEQNLYIDIPAGYQRLDGGMAEGLVRYREYRLGDVDRNAVQIEFMKQLLRQTLNKEAIMNNPGALIDVLLHDVRTNIGTDFIKYIPYLNGIRGDNITAYTLPGEGRYVNGISYFFADAKKLPDVINEVFYASQH